MSVLAEQHENWTDAHARLMLGMKRNAKRPGANLPRTGTTPFRTSSKDAVDYSYALRLVEEATDVPADLIAHSGYCAAIAARHLLWTVLVDGGHSFNHVGRLFHMDASSVRLAVQSFRDFQTAKSGMAQG